MMSPAQQPKLSKPQCFVFIRPYSCSRLYRRSLARGMQGLAVRVAKNLNRSWLRRGAVFADRFGR